MSNEKQNLKNAVGSRKFSISSLSLPVLVEMSVGAYEGNLKYGRYNYRESEVLASLQWDAAQRHLMQWWEGEDIDQGSGMSHITKALTALMIMRDAMIRGNFKDDRYGEKYVGQKFFDSVDQIVSDNVDKYLPKNGIAQKANSGE